MRNFLPLNHVQVRTTVTPGIPKAIEWLEYSAPELVVHGSNPGASVSFSFNTTGRATEANHNAPLPIDPLFMRPPNPISLCADHLQRRWDHPGVNIWPTQRHSLIPSSALRTGLERGTHLREGI